MSIAVLPFNSGPNTRHPLARQFANFAAEIVRARTGAEIHSVNYLARINEEEPPQFANVNPSEELSEPEMIQQLFGQTDANLVLDGLLSEKDGGFELTYRLFARNQPEIIGSDTLTFKASEALGAMRKLIVELATRSEKELPAEAATDEDLFGTTHPEAFIKFLEGYDALQYIERTQGQVIQAFQPELGLECLRQSAALDKEWDAPVATH
jgi:hypothetical protein